MAPIDFVFCLSALIIGVLAQKVILAIERNPRLRRRRIARQSLARIADVTPGMRVKLRGQAQPPAAPLIAPLTGRAVLAWMLVVRHFVGGREREARLDHACDFLLRDESGEVLVRGARAAVVCAAGEPALVAEPSPSLARRFAELGVASRWLGTRWAPRAAEGVLACDAHVTVFGLARRDGATLIIDADEESPLYLAPAD